METSKAKNARIIILLYSIMIIIGFVGNLRGVLLPSIKKDLGINYSDIGLMIFITSLGYFSSTFIGGFIGDRVGQRKILAFGFAVVTVGLIGVFYTSNFLFLVVTMLVLNIGMGCFDIGLNSLASRVFITNTAVMMSLMHVFFGLGSSASPELGGWMLSVDISWNRVYLYSLVLIAAVFILFVFSPIKLGPAARTSSKLPVSGLLKDKRIWLFVGILGFSEATEGGVGTWLINFLQVERGFNKTSSAQYMFYFFIIYTIGRIFGGYIAEKLGYVRTVLTVVSAEIVLLICGLSFGGSWAILFSLTGFFISMMYPTIITIISKEYPEGISSVLGIILTASGLMSVGTSWLIGKVNDSVGVFTGFALIPVYASMLIILLLIQRRFLSYQVGGSAGRSVGTNQSEG